MQSFSTESDLIFRNQKTAWAGLRFFCLQTRSHIAYNHCKIKPNGEYREQTMEYTVGSVGRVVVMRLNEGEDLYESIESVAKKEDIRSAAVLITGGLRSASVVVGPKQEKPEIVGDFRQFAGPGEVLGVGTIYCDDEGPKMHIHTAIGKGDLAMVGCPRGGAKIFLVMEITIIEIAGINAKRTLDESSGIKLLKLQ